MDKTEFDELFEEIKKMDFESPDVKIEDDASAEEKKAFLEKLAAEKPYTGEPVYEPDTEQADEQDGQQTGENDGKSEDEEKSEKTRMEIYDWIQCFVTALIAGVLIFIFVGRTIGVDGTSMVDTLRHNDRVVMHNLFYTPEKGDIVVFQSKNEERFHDVPLVKRVIATAGDEIDINFETGDVIVNGNVIFEPYIHTVTTNSEGFDGPVTIPEGFVFVMGDNRNSSVDSRDSSVGLIDTRYILGNVIFLLIPGENDVQPRDWSRFGVVH